MEGCFRLHCFKEGVKGSAFGLLRCSFCPCHHFSSRRTPRCLTGALEHIDWDKRPGACKGASRSFGTAHGVTTLHILGVDWIIRPGKLFLDHASGQTLFGGTLNGGLSSKFQRTRPFWEEEVSRILRCPQLVPLALHPALGFSQIPTPLNMELGAEGFRPLEVHFCFHFPFCWEDYLGSP